MGRINSAEVELALCFHGSLYGAIGAILVPEVAEAVGVAELVEVAIPSQVEPRQWR